MLLYSRPAAGSFTKYYNINTHVSVKKRRPVSALCVIVFNATQPFFSFFLSRYIHPISRVLIIFVFVIALQTLSVGVAVNCSFRSFLSALQLFYVSMAFSIACGSHFATIAIFIVCCGFLILRIRCINLILGQLIIDDPISEEFLFLPTGQQNMLSQDFFYMNQYQQQQQRQQQHHQRKQNEQLASSLPSQCATATTADSNIKHIQMKWLWRKGAKDVDIDVSTTHWSVANLWPSKIFSTNHDTNEWHHLNKFVNQFNLTDIKTIFRV